MNQQEVFAPRNKSEWLDKVIKDLKGKDILSLNSELWPGNIISPFYHAEDIQESSFLPNNEEIKIGVNLKVGNDPKAINSRILEELSGGVNLVYLDFDENSTTEYQTIFNEVLIDLIELRIKARVDFDISVLENQFQKQDGAIIQKNFTTLHTEKNTLFYDAKRSTRELLLSLLHQGYNMMTQEHSIKTLYVEFPFSHDFFMNIIKVRAARLLWLNLLDAVKTDHSFQLKIDGIIPRDMLSTNHYDNMISFTSMALSMMIAGVDSMFIPPSDILDRQNGTADTRRISRNITQILSLESHLDKVKDVASGSYFFEKETQKLAREVWEKFVNK